MDDKIHPIPMLLERLDHLIGGAVNADIIRHGDGAAQSFGERQNTFGHHVILIGEGEFRAGFRHRFSDAVSDGFIIGDPHDEAAFACHQARHYDTFLRARLALVPPKPKELLSAN